MAGNLKWMAVCIASLIAPVLLSTMAKTADEQYTATTIVQLPDGQVLRSFDISFVDPNSHTYALAVSATAPAPAVGPATNPRIVIVDTQTNVVIHEFNASPTFAGNCSIPPARDDYSGPNGVMVIEKGRNADIWAGDGPIFNTSCDPTSGMSRLPAASRCWTCTPVQPRR